MPLESLRKLPVQNPSPGGGLSRLRRLGTPAVEEQPESSWGGIGLGLAGVLAGGALLARKPQLAKTVLGKAVRAGNVGRQQIMLSGMALPKSILGGVGAIGERAIETKSLDPIRQLLAPQTLQDIKTAWKTGQQVGPAGTHTASKWAVPGRAIGAVDTAMQGALQRSGAGLKEAESALLQAPLPPQFKALENPVAQYVHPFRRTPFNQWFEGYGKFQKAYEGDKAAQRGLALYGAAGAAHGAATADERYPVSVPFGVAASARYGVPYGLAALVGRKYLGGSKTGGGIADQINPVGAYGVEQGVLDPLKPLTNPAFRKWIPQ